MKLKQTRRALRARQQYEPPQPVHPVDSQTSDSSSRAPGPAGEGHLELTAPLTRPRRIRKLRKNRQAFDHTLPTPQSELIRNYLKVISQLRPAGKGHSQIVAPIAQPRRVSLPKKCKLSYVHGPSTSETRLNHHPIDGASQVQPANLEGPLNTPPPEVQQPPLEATPPDSDHLSVPRPRFAPTLASLLCLLA